MLTIYPITQENIDTIRALRDVSVEEGYGFVQKLWDDYHSGKNRFDAPGAALLSVYEADVLVAVGGVHPDPYLDDPAIGRIRHVYVLPERRRGGIGRALMQALIVHAAAQFTTLTLRTVEDDASAFYVALGFQTQPRFKDATHWMEI